MKVARATAAEFTVATNAGIEPEAERNDEIDPGGDDAADSDGQPGRVPGVEHVETLALCHRPTPAMITALAPETTSGSKVQAEGSQEGDDGGEDAGDGDGLTRDETGLGHGGPPEVARGDVLQRALSTASDATIALWSSSITSAMPHCPGSRVLLTSGRVRFECSVI